MAEIVHPAIVLLTLVSATIAIASKYLGWYRNVFYISKPLATVLILAPVLVLIPESQSAYIPLIAGGLAFALFGDILLMLPEDRFVLGIGSFATTHALYLAAFISAAGLALINPSTIPLFLFSIIMTRFLWSGLRKSLQIPVFAYVVLITVMTAQAIGSAVQSDGAGPAIAAVGAILFLASDSMLAIDRFRVPFKAAQGMVLATYWVGQWLIALSARLGDPSF